MKQDDETMTSAPLSASGNKPASVQDKAEENLKFIRDAMEGATAFTSISGVGLAFTGLAGLTAAWLELTSNQGSASSPNLFIWMSALVIAASGSTAMTMYKARQQGTTLWSVSGRKLLYAFSPTLFVGGVITWFLASAGMNNLLPGIWLCLYGAAVMTAGAHSIAMIKLIGGGFIVFGSVAFALPDYSILMLALGFGGLHLSAGYLIWKYYGG